MPPAVSRNTVAILILATYIALVTPCTRAATLAGLQFPPAQLRLRFCRRPRSNLSFMGALFAHMRFLLSWRCDRQPDRASCRPLPFYECTPHDEPRRERSLGKHLRHLARGAGLAGTLSRPDAHDAPSGRQKHLHPARQGNVGAIAHP